MNHADKDIDLARAFADSLKVPYTAGLSLQETMVLILSFSQEHYDVLNQFFANKKAHHIIKTDPKWRQREDFASEFNRTRDAYQQAGRELVAFAYRMGIDISHCIPPKE